MCFGTRMFVAGDLKNEYAPLARALYGTVEIDEIIPREHYEAVAKVIGFVMQQAKRRRALAW